MESVSAYGLHIAADVLANNGYEILEKDDYKSDIITTLYWYDQVYNLIRFRYAPQNRKRKIIVGGNLATSNPAALIAMEFDVFLGDGELCQNIENSPYLINKNKKYGELAIAETFWKGQYIEIQKQARQFIELSRGCKNHCLFCQYSWLKKYRERSATEIYEILRNFLKEKNLKVACADRFQHSEYSQIKELFLQFNVNDTGSDVSLKSVLENPEEYFSITRSGKVQTGIEGMSYRLRKLIGKPFSDEKIIWLIKKMIEMNHHRLDVYMIYGLPTETETDINAFDNLLTNIGNSIKSGYKFVIVIHWNAFTPSAMTPMQWEAPAYNYKYKTQLNNLMSNYKYNNITVVHAPKLTSDLTILKRMVANRCSERSAHILFQTAKNIRCLKTGKYRKMIFDEFEKVVGYHIMDQMELTTELPWQRFFSNGTELMLIKIAKKLRSNFREE